MSQAVPSARLGGLYGLYFALVALIVAWLGPYFQALGYTASEIGILIGILTGSKIVAPYLWGMLGDRIPNRLRVVQAGMLGSALVSGWLLATPGFWQLVVILAVLGLFWNAIIAQFDTLTLEYLGVPTIAIRRFGCGDRSVLFARCLPVGPGFGCSVLKACPGCCWSGCCYPVC